MREALVEALSRRYGVHAYGKWGGAFWRLLSLVDLGVEPGRPGAVAAADETLEWVASPRRLSEIHKRRIDGRVRRCASQEGRALQACVDVGLRAAIPGSTRSRSRSSRRSGPTGGWNCDRHPHLTHSSFNETWGPIFGLARYGADEAVARGTEFLLLHRVMFSHRTGEPAHPSMLKLHFPAYWHYDLLAGLRTLAASGALSDERTGDALDLLEEKRRPDGTWRTQGRCRRSPGRTGATWRSSIGGTLRTSS